MKYSNQTTKEIKFATKNRNTILPNSTAKFVNDVFAIILFSISIILVLIFYTYSPSDPNWFSTTDSNVINNGFGKIGATFASIAFYLFGKSAWIVAVGFFYLGIKKITASNLGDSNIYNLFKVCIFIVLLISLSSLEYIYNNSYKSNLNNLSVVGELVFNHLRKFIDSKYIVIIILLTIWTSIIIIFKDLVLKICSYLGLFIEFVFYIVPNTSKKKSSIVNNTTLNNEVVNNKPSKNDSKNPSESNFSNLLDTNQTEVIKEPFFKNPRKKITKVEHNLSNKLPSTSLLDDVVEQPDTISKESIEYVAKNIETKLSEFGVEARVTNSESGPVITRYELLPSKGVRGDKIVGLSKEIARGLALTNVRVVETIPGKNSMGIEIPNFKRKNIYVKEIFDSTIYKNTKSKLTLVLGKDIAGNVVVTDLAKMPHLLVAGTTGSGKSVALNAMILSILFQATPEEVKFIMIDPKMVELSFYYDIPHLLSPVVTDMSQASNALKWTVGEMERRYMVMSKLGCKNIDSFNQKIMEAKKNGLSINDPLQPEGNEVILEKWHYIVVIIDELADLMMVAGKKIEQFIARIAQKARAVGIHLIVATQRPSVDVITGLIKANIPARISFQVSSKIDSRTILDQMGAEALLGQGDMLFLQPGSGLPQRIHGAYVNDKELNRVVDYLKTTGKPEYIEGILSGDTNSIEIVGIENEGNSNNVEKDLIFDEAIKFIYETKRCAISSLQTRFGIGYNRAARIMSQLEEMGMVRRNDRGGFEIIKTENVN